MICPRCRKLYSEKFDRCPHCDCELIGLMGDADAPETEAGRMGKVFIDNDGSSSPVLYRMVTDDEMKRSNKNVIPILLLVFGIIFAAASAFCFWKGIDATNVRLVEASVVNGFISSIL